MKVFIHTSLVLMISLLFTNCGSLNRAESLRMLDVRANYQSNQGSDLSFREAGVESFRNHPVPTRTRTKVAPVFAFSHEMPNHDYFWGGWISVVVEKDQWVMSKPQLVPAAKVVNEIPSPPQPEGILTPIPLIPPATKNQKNNHKF